MPLPLYSRARRLVMQLTVKLRARAALSKWPCIVTSAIALTVCLAMWPWLNGCWSESEYPYHETVSLESFEHIRLSLPNESDASGGCVSPQLPLFNQLIRDHRPKAIPPDLCVRAGPLNWLRVSQSKIFLRKEFAGATCSAEPIVRVSDDRSEFASAQPIRDGSELPSLGFRATCTAQDGTVHKSVYYGIKRVQLETRQHARPQQDNIVILGMDSLSRLESLRSLREVSALMHSKLGAVTLKQYNILGDGTPAALLPILTGVTEEEMPEGRKGFKAARHLDESMRWIFRDLRDQGYVTMFGEEQSTIGTFQMRFLGFKKEPTDFYLRPVLQQQEPLQSNDICIGDEMAGARMLQAAKDLFTLYPNRPKFVFLFFSTLSHENKDLTPMDSELTKFVDWFVKEDLVRNSSVILMSDHGQRHGPMRNSMQGKLEESLPLMSIALSRQLKSHRKAALQTLTDNAKRLTTPVDIHQTLLSLAGVRDARGKQDRVTSYSLIDETVPVSRTCSSAGISTHWCSCLRLTKLVNPDSHQLAVRAARFAVSQMNAATHAFRDVCEVLRLDSVTEVDVSVASNEMSQRERRVSDKTNMAYNVGNTAITTAGFLNIRFITAPNNGLYEATVQFSLMSGKRSLIREHLQLSGETSRINQYGNQAMCVVSAAPNLRKFCFCRQSANQPPA